MSVLLYSGETLAVVEQHVSPWAVFQMNCLPGISLCDHVPSVVTLDSCNTLCVNFRLQGKRFRWQVMFSGCKAIDCLRSFCLVKSRGFAHLAATCIFMN